MLSSKTIACLLGCLWFAMAGLACAGAKPAVSGKSTFVGVFGLPPGRAVDWPFAVTRAAPEELTGVRDAGLKALVALTGSKKNYSDSFGCFRLPLWKQALDRHDSGRIQGLVDEGVIKGLYAIDEPHDWACGPSFADIDAACAYAGTKWPKLKCGVNAPPGWLKPGREQLPHLGFLFFQYASGRGDPESWLAKQMADASWFQGDIWLSIQLLKPWISVSEFRRAALHFCSARPTGLLMWKWSEEWFAQAGVTSAMQEVAAACASPARTVVGKPAAGAP